MAAFSFVDPRTGIRYWGQQAQEMFVAHNMGGLGPQKGNPGTSGDAPPPPGTYDPAIDYNAGAAQRGYDQTRDDASTAFERGQEDYGLDVGDMTRGRDWTLADLTRGETRLNEDHGQRTDDLKRQFGILGRQQAERAAQQGITSQGLLGRSQQARDENQGREQTVLDLVRDRGREDIATGRERTNTTFDEGKKRLDLGFGRQFGGWGGNQWNNPLTGKPMVGDLLTNVTRAGTENNAFQTFSGQQRSQQATQAGYIAPGIIPVSPSRSAAEEFQRRIRGKK